MRLVSVSLWGVNENGDVIINSLWPAFYSLGYKNLGAEGGKAIAEALKVNTSITNIE